MNRRSLATMMVFSLGLIGGVAFAAAGPTSKPADDHRLTLTGTIVFSDGTPASGATVTTSSTDHSPPSTAHADAAGLFRLRDEFAFGARLLARSADGKQQALLMISAGAVRSSAVTPLKLTLAPAVEHEVTVVAEGRPVEAARVSASGLLYEVQGVTGPDGKARFSLPAQERLHEVNAWHPALGVRGIRDDETRAPRKQTKLSLLPPGPFLIKVVDTEGTPVAGVELGVEVNTEDAGWVVTSKFEAAHARTDARGAVVLPWAPLGKLKYVDVRMLDVGWKIDRTDLERINDREVTVHARRHIPVEGRLVMPSGANPEGILITGFGFGPGNNGDRPTARVRADGSFTIRAASDHGYGLGVVDAEWASDPWSGMILEKETSSPAAISLNAYRATPLVVRVTRGKDHNPVANAWVDVGRVADFNWVDSTGKKRSGRATFGDWLTTDARGLARTGAGRDKTSVRLSSGSWMEEKTIVVDSEKAAEADFHRNWEGERKVTVLLLSDGRRYEPSATLRAHGWIPRGRGVIPKRVDPKANPDGTYQVVFDAESLTLFFNDPDKRRSGFGKVDSEGLSADVNMVAMASYGGTLRDEAGQPLAGQTVSLSVQNAGVGVGPVSSQTGDSIGAFHFDAVPADVPLSLWLGDGTRRAEYAVFGNELLFSPGEARTGEAVTARRPNAPAPIAVAKATVPLADRLASTCRNARVAGMRALLILKWDDSKNVVALTGHLQDGDDITDLYSYLPIRVEPSEFQADSATLVKHGLPKPSPGKIVLAALGGHQDVVATQEIDAGDLAAAIASAKGFLKRYKPPVRDALTSLNEAREEARKSGRRVWIVHGGPRCGPCFRLGVWMEEHHAALEKDYVIVKVMGGLDERAEEVVKQLPESEGDGIPWFAITEPDGKILATSHGPLGNIGYPGDLQGRRHFKTMLDRTVQKLSATEVEGLIRSLEAEGSK